MELLKGIARDKTGTRPARQLRLEGMIPGVIYGHGLENVSFAVSSRDIESAIHQGEQLVKMAIGEKEDNYLIKAVQRDAFDNEIIHVDFTRVNLDETVEVTVQLTLKGSSKGEAEGGVLTNGVTSVTISCPVVKIPDEIIVRINDLGLNEALHVSDIPEDGFKMITDGDAVVVSCHEVAEEVEEEGEEGEEASDEPEVIGKGKEEPEE